MTIRIPAQRNIYSLLRCGKSTKLPLLVVVIIWKTIYDAIVVGTPPASVQSPPPVSNHPRSHFHELCLFVCLFLIYLFFVLSLEQMG